jgi:hypothetical protein
MIPKHRELVKETLLELSRKSNFCCIYPAKGSDLYDCFFTSPKPVNKLLYRYLYSDEMFPYKEGHLVNPQSEKLNYYFNFEVPSYDSYKKKSQNNLIQSKVEPDVQEKDPYMHKKNQSYQNA